ncbi:MAG: trimethylamine methyltransferase family protein [Candidatus Latescibacteria bacterium]|nr:trimethylamine methyltransferase family protein [Candidatus Latescibacterota bacterium]
MLQRLTNTQLDKLHAATLQVMERSGVRFLDDDALDVFRSAGCRVDGNLVRFSPDLIERSLDTCPKQLTLCDQEGQARIELAGRCAYYGNGSDLLFIIDHRTGERREPVLQDLRDMMTVLDALPDIDFVMSGFIPRDVPGEVMQKWQMAVMLEETSKPIINVTTDLAEARAAVEMAEIVAGSADALRKRPFVANYINIANPLRHNPESIQRLMWLSAEGLPFVYRPSAVTRGISTPITWAGSLVVNNAAGLAGLVLSQLVREGAPFIRCSCSGGTFDMRTMIGLHPAAELRGHNEDMAEYYRLPRFGLGAVCGSKTVDQQAAFEAALTLLTATQSGAQLIHDVGYMDNGAMGSLEQLVICHEMIGWVKQYMKDIEVNDETLALDVIDQVVNEDSHFLDTDHTLRHFREDHYPELIDRGNYDRWLDQGGTTLRDRARAKVDEILDENRAPRLPEDTVSQLHALVGSP